jgi:maltose alpha-D-glucosyltransferase/alpha-amylase
VLAFTRTYEDETLLVIVNFSKFSQAAEIDLAAFNGAVPMEMISRNKFPAVKADNPYFFTLSPHSFYWFILNTNKPEVKETHALPGLVLKQWDNILESRNFELLETTILRAYLQDVKWFNSAGKTVYSLRIQECEMLHYDNSSALLLLLESSYERGLPEIYQLCKCRKWCEADC